MSACWLSRDELSRQQFTGKILESHRGGCLRSPAVKISKLYLGQTLVFPQKIKERRPIRSGVL